MRKRLSRARDATHDGLLQTLQVLLGLFVAFVQESLGGERNTVDLAPSGGQSEKRQADIDLRELLQAFALGAVLTLQPLKVSAHLSQLQLQLRVTAGDKGGGRRGGVNGAAE